MYSREKCVQSVFIFTVHNVLISCHYKLMSLMWHQRKDGKKNNHENENEIDYKKISSWDVFNGDKNRNQTHRLNHGITRAVTLAPTDGILIKPDRQKPWSRFDGKHQHTSKQVKYLQITYITGDYI